MEKNESSKMAAGKLRDYLRATKGTRAPIWHCLKEKDHYIKNMYFKTLCMVQGYDPDGTEEQTLFLQRLLAGSAAEYDLLTYMRQGRELTAEEYEEFAGKMKEDHLQYHFALDALLIAGLGGGSDEMVQFVAELCESLCIAEAEMKFLVNISAAVLRQDFFDCIMLMCNCPKSIISDMWAPYVTCDDKVIFENTGGRWNLIAANSKGVNLVDYGGIQIWNLSSSIIGIRYSIPSILITGTTACLYNLEINLVTGLFFEGFDRINLVNCKFSTDGTKTHDNKDAVSICFSNCKQVSIENCIFQDFHGRTIYAEDTPSIIIVGSEFLNCFVECWFTEGHWRELGGLIHGNPENTYLELTRCRFANCGGSNKYHFYSSSILSNCQVQITNCVFDNCWYYYDGDKKDPSNPNRCLFRHIVKESGNILNDSAELGPH